jgi:hypothetical protein
MYTLKQKMDTFSIIEEKHNEKSIIISSKDRDKMRNLYKNMKRGGGFSGWTPNFMCEAVNVR